MRKFLLTGIACVMAASANAQIGLDETGASVVLDAREDTTQIYTIHDIVTIQENVVNSNTAAAHKAKVWGRKAFFNLGYNYSSTMRPKDPIKTGFDLLNGGLCQEFKNDYGINLTLGNSYALHRKPIANVVRFNLDWTFFNLNFNHFKAEKPYVEGDKEYLFDSSSKFGSSNDYYHTPWNAEKYAADFSWALGPSVTVAPFTYLKPRGLHFIKIHAYWHIGYGASIMWFQTKERNDFNSNEHSNDFTTFNNSLKINWGHGLTQTVGFNLSWKGIGLGWETRSGNTTWTSIAPADFGKYKYKFTNHDSRIYLTIKH